MSRSRFWIACGVGLCAAGLGSALMLANSATLASGDAQAGKAAASPSRFAPSKARLERGRYLAESVLVCEGCHSEVDWQGTGLPRPGVKFAGGRVPEDAVPIQIYAPNLTPDKETGSGNWTDEQWERALRQGIGNDGRALFPFMPYVFFREMSAEDLASIVVYFRSLPPVKHAMPKLEWPEELKKLYPGLPPRAAPPAQPDMNNPVSRGKYLVTIAPCGVCHTPVDQQLHPLMNLSFGGGQPLHGPWGKVNSANVTPDPSGIPHYDEAMFIKTIRTGKVNGVRDLNHIMPWKVFRNMTDRDLKDIFAYLKTLPPVQHRVDNTEPPTPCKLCNYSHGYGNRN